MSEQFHYPADLLELLIETIPRLARSKKSVILFFRGPESNRQTCQEQSRHCAHRLTRLPSSRSRAQYSHA